MAPRFAPFPRRRRTARSLASAAALLAVAAAALAPRVARAQADAATGAIAGVVSDSATRAPLPGAQVVALLAPGGRTTRSTVTDAEGRYRLAPLPPGTYTLRVYRIGYLLRTVESVPVTAGATTTRDLWQRVVPHTLGEVTTRATSSREGQETAVVDVPAERQRTYPPLNVTDAVRDVTGMHAPQTGLLQGPQVARGFNNVFSGAMLTLTDYRYAFVPSLHVNTPFLVPTTSEDVERIEVVLGPASALYGPNASNGVLHVITRSPFTSRGTTLSAGVGERSLMRYAVRHAGVVGSRVGYKVMGNYVSGRDWPSSDVEEPAGRRDLDIRKYAGEARVDVKLGSRDTTLVILSAGRTQAGSAVEMTGLGAAQAKDWRYDYVQARVSRGRLSAQAFRNASDAGGTFLLRTENPIVDRSTMDAVQVSHVLTFGGAAGAEVTYGGDYQRTNPRTGGTINGRNEADDEITEAGGYVHARVPLTPRLDIIGAARGDKHNRLSETVFSPRLGFVYRPRTGHNLRLTYNRAFDTPSTNNLFLDLPILNALPIPGGVLPYAVRAEGVPAGGFHFGRDCGGRLCMRTPFGQDPSALLPADATLLWPAFVEIARQRGIDLSGIPAPTSADIATAFARLDVESRGFERVDPARIADIPAIRPTISNVLELGYQGAVGGGLRVTAALFRERKQDFVGPLLVETPNVFFEGSSLRTYLARFVGDANAQQIAALGAQLPLGTVTPRHRLTNSPDLVVTYRNFGKIDLWGSDLGLEATAGRTELFANYSYLSRDLYSRRQLGGLSDIAVNSPRHKGVLGARFRDAARGLFAEARVRSADGFPMNSGVYVGPVNAFSVVDASVRVRVMRDLQATVSAQNLLDYRHVEFVGGAEIGRLLFAQLQYTLPGSATAGQ